MLQKWLLSSKPPFKPRFWNKQVAKSAVQNFGQNEGCFWKSTKPFQSYDIFFIQQKFKKLKLF